MSFRINEAATFPPIYLIDLSDKMVLGSDHGYGFRSVLEGGVGFQAVEGWKMGL